MISINELLELMNQRRSIRYFSEKKIDRTTIDTILDSARLAPSVENTKPWNFHVIMNTEMKTKIMEFSCYGNFVLGAGAFIVVTCDRSSKGISNAPIWNPKEMEFSCVAAMHSMMLAATALGLGSCWVSLHHGPVHNLLKLKDHQVVIGGLMIGHLKEGEQIPSSIHDMREKDKIITYYE